MSEFVDTVLKYLNENPGVGIIIAAIAVLVTIVGWFIKKKQKSVHKNFPHTTVGGNVSSGRDIIVGNSTIINSNGRKDDIPEFHLHLYGAGSKRKIEGHIEKKDSRTLVVESVQINGVVNDVNRQFTRLLPLKNLNHSDELFTTKTQGIKVKVIYKTLNGDRFEYSQKMTQGSRADGLFNVSLEGAPLIKTIGNAEVENTLSQLDKELKKANSVTGLASIRIPRIESIYKNWVDKNKEIYSIIQNSDYKGRLNAILLANNLSSYTIK